MDKRKAYGVTLWITGIFVALVGLLLVYDLATSGERKRIVDENVRRMEEIRQSKKR